MANFSLRPLRKSTLTAQKAMEIGIAWFAILAALACVLPNSADAAGTSAATKPATLTLKASPSATGNQITFGDLFENARELQNIAIARAPGAGQRVVFAASALQARVSAAGSHWSNQEGVREVVVNGSARPQAGQAPTIAGRPTGEAVALAVVTRTVPRGEVIAVEDVAWMDAPANSPRDAITDPDMLVGKTAKRTLVANAALRGLDVMDTAAVRRNETVVLVYEAGGLKLSVRGRALGDAPIGGAVKVLNPRSNKTLDAIVDGPGSARVLTSDASVRVAGL